MAALLTSVMGNNDKVVEYIKECNSLGIEVLKPNINKSYSKFSVDGKNIRFGMSAIKNVGTNVINGIVKERENFGEFKDLNDLANRINQGELNKKAVESLIKSGAFDEISENRRTLMNGYEDILNSISSDRKKNIKGQISLFETFEEDDEDFNKLEFYEEFSEKDKLNLEKEVLGMYVSSHPLKEYEDKLKNKTSIDNAKLISLREESESYLKLDKQQVIMGGIITRKTIKTTKTNKLMAFVELEDLYGSIEVVIFPQMFDKYQNKLMEDSILLIKGTLDISENENPKLMANYIADLDEERKRVYIKISSRKEKELLEKVINICKNNLGNDELYFYYEDEKKMFRYDRINVESSDFLINSLSNLLGYENVKLKNI